MLTSRQVKLLKILESEQSYQPIGKFAKELGISDRTIYSEIKLLIEEGYQINSKRGKGIKLVNQRGFDDRPILNISTDPAETRRIEIMKSLLFDHATVTLKGLSDHYFVSQTSIKNDLKFIEGTLFQNNLSFLNSNKSGTKIEKMPLDQKILVLFNFNQYIMTFKANLGNDIFEDRIDSLTEYYSSEVISVCKNVLYTFIRSNVMTILDTYIESLLNIYIIFVSQLLTGNHFEKTINPLDKKHHAFYVSTAVTLLHKASLRLGFEYTNSDIEYLSQMLLNYRFEPIPVQQNDDKFVTALLEDVSKAMSINFLEDQYLFDQLSQHIPAMLYRLKYHTHIQNPFTDKIKLEFAITYNVLWLVLQDLGQELDVVFNEDEVAYLTIYFQLSIEKIGKSRKILIVCQTGIVTSELLINRIKKVVPSLDQVEIASLSEMYEKDLTCYDFVLTTIETNLELPNLYYVSPFIKNEEITQLLTGNPYSNNVTIGKKDQIEANYYIPMLNQDFKTKEELLNSVGQNLVEMGYVQKEFVASLLDREKMGSTEFPLGVALPHGRPEFVLKTVVVFIQNTHKIKWKESLVDTVFLIALSRDDIKNVKDIILKINKTISNEEVLRQLKSETRELEVYKLLNQAD